TRFGPVMRCSSIRLWVAAIAAPLGKGLFQVYAFGTQGQGCFSRYVVQSGDVSHEESFPLSPWASKDSGWQRTENGPRSLTAGGRVAGQGYGSSPDTSRWHGTHRSITSSGPSRPQVR